MYFIGNLWQTNEQTGFHLFHVTFLSCITSLDPSSQLCHKFLRGLLFFHDILVVLWIYCDLLVCFFICLKTGVLYSVHSREVSFKSRGNSSSHVICKVCVAYFDIYGSWGNINQRNGGRQRALQQQIWAGIKPIMHWITAVPTAWLV